MVKTLFILGASFAFWILKGHSPPNPHFLLDKIATLNHNLNTLETMKKHYAEDEAQIKLDEQRIEGLEQQIQSHKKDFDETARYFINQKKTLQDRNKYIEEALADSNQFMKDQRSARVAVMSELSEDVAKTHGDINIERGENMELRRAIGQLRTELEKQKGLRGNQRGGLGEVSLLNANHDTMM